MNACTLPPAVANGKLNTDEIKKNYSNINFLIMFILYLANFKVMKIFFYYFEPAQILG